MDTQILVIGAGPAGSMAALSLSRAGIETVLADRCGFPRDKACGDALIPDSLAALERMGLRSAVAACARSLRSMRVHAPDGRHVELRGEFLSLPRRAFDSILQTAATAEGAAFVPGVRALEPLTADGVVCGARFETIRGGSGVAIRARLTLLATGAAAGPLSAFGVCLSTQPGALAMRAYYRVPESLDREADYLCICYEKGIRPGYAWIFPGPDRTFNLGVGFFRDARRGEDPVRLRALWAAFTQGFGPARRILEEGECVGVLRGAPLRTALKGARLHRKGLLVIGEAAGLTYPFSGEGIGKAMESGLLAAEIAGRHLTLGSPCLDEVGPVYENTLRSRYGSRYLAYQRAQNWLSRPALCNFIAWRAERSKRLRDQLEGMLTETTDPLRIFSAAGLFRALFL